MTAGLFREHGVFFGRTTGPAGKNRKGFLESVWMKRTFHAGEVPDWPRSWYHRLAVEGWSGEVPWGAKMMPLWWKYLKQTSLRCIVLCYRPEDQILASCRRVRWRRSPETIERDWAQMDRIREEADCPVFRVDADRLVEFDLDQLSGPFEALGLELSESIVRRWIDPELFHR